jgi:uncharacterized Zn finger protein (UPF0148 family)
MDELDDATQPRCPECGTVLHDMTGALVCRSCNLVFLPHLASPK